MTTVDSTKLRSLGRQLGEYVQSQASSHVSPMALQGVVADLSAGMPDLQAPLRDLVCRQSFAALLVHARSGGGAIQRDALIQEISRVYHPDVLVQVEEVLNGFLDGSGGIATSLMQNQTPYKSEGAPITSNAPSVSRLTDPPSSSLPVNRSNGFSNSTGPSAKKLILVFSMVGAAAILLSAIFHGMSSGKSCSVIADELSLLDAETSEYKDMIAEYKESCAEDSGFLVQEANLLRIEGQTQKAMKLIDQAIKINPDNAKAFYWQGVLYTNLSDYDKSLAAYNRALQLNPKEPWFAFGKGVALSWLDRPEEAISWLSEAIKLDSSEATFFRERGHVKALTLKRYAAGLEDLNKAIQIDSSDGISYQIRSFIKTWLDDYSAACEDIKKARQLGLKEAYRNGKYESIDMTVAEICN